MQEHKRMPLRRAIPLAYEVWNSLPAGEQKDALESVIFQAVRQIQQQERQKALDRNRKYYEAHREEILEKQKKRNLTRSQLYSAEVEKKWQE